MASSPTRFLGRVIVLFRVHGVEIAFTPSWLVMVVVLSLVFRDLVVSPATGDVAAAAMSVGLTLVFYLCVLLHEAAHTAVAHVFGLQPRRILLFMLGGVSQIARDADEPKQEYLVALAGPLTSLLIAGILSIGSTLGGGTFDFEGVWGTLALVNLALAAFNMIPGFPLDGGRVLRATVWAVTGSRLRATRIASAGGRIVAAGFAAGGVAYILTRTDEFADMFPGVLYIVLGWFLYSHASFAEREDVHREMVREQARAAAAAPEPQPGGLVTDIVPGMKAGSKGRSKAPLKAGARASGDIVPGGMTPKAAKARLKPAPKQPARKAAVKRPASTSKVASKPVAGRRATARKAKTANESNAAKPEANRGRPRRSQRQATAGKAVAQPGKRAGDSRRGSADARGRADRKR